MIGGELVENRWRIGGDLVGFSVEESAVEHADVLNEWSKRHEVLRDHSLV